MPSASHWRTEADQRPATKGRKPTHAAGVRASRGLQSRYLEPRMWTAPGVLATSTQESPSLPLL